MRRQCQTKSKRVKLLIFGGSKQKRPYHAIRALSLQANAA
jgi:hypothetical protein